MVEFLQFIVRHIVDRPEAVAIDCIPKEDRLIFTLKVDKADIGKVIGRNGRTALAMRVLLGAVAAREGKRAILDIVE
jgi:predicted RNA-binding protein YlqC (UPF0109 family)